MAKRGRPKKKPAVETFVNNITQAEYESRLAKQEEYIKELELSITNYINSIISLEEKIKEYEAKPATTVVIPAVTASTSVPKQEKKKSFIQPRKLFEALRVVAKIKLQPFIIAQVIQEYEKQ